ncbi:hypothetical protein HY498_03205 [Candidatus Woesearchaeota archaeon]|nr:hypothetical protein [Candidatus Woesearchaeota archaeon]
MEYRQIEYQKDSEVHIFRYLPGDESKLTQLLFDAAKDPDRPDFDELDALLISHTIAPPDLHDTIKKYFEEIYS